MAPPPAGPARSPRNRPPGIAASHCAHGFEFPRRTCVHQLRTARPRGPLLPPGTPVLRPRPRPPAQGGRLEGTAAPARPTGRHPSGEAGWELPLRWLCQITSAGLCPHRAHVTAPGRHRRHRPHRPLAGILAALPTFAQFWGSPHLCTPPWVTLASCSDPQCTSLAGSRCKEGS